MNVDLSRIDRLTERQEAKAKLQEMNRLKADRDAAGEPIRERYATARQELRERHDNEMLELCRPFEDELAAASAPFDERIGALEEDIADFEMDCDTYEWVTCALTGLPMFEGEDRFTDQETGEVILRAALGLPEDEPAEPAATEAAG